MTRNWRSKPGKEAPVKEETVRSAKNSLLVHGWPGCMQEMPRRGAKLNSYKSVEAEQSFNCCPTQGHRLGSLYPTKLEYPGKVLRISFFFLLNLLFWTNNRWQDIAKISPMYASFIFSHGCIFCNCIMMSKPESQHYRMCAAQWHFITGGDLCNHLCNQDTKLFHHHEELPRTTPL